jgi:hypothetical protein
MDYLFIEVNFQMPSGAGLFRCAVLMNDGIFQIAFKRVRSRYSEEAWLALLPRQITEAIYQEIRAIDAERHAQPAEDPPDAARRTA